MNNAFQDQVGTTIEESVTNAANLDSVGASRSIGYLMERDRGVENEIVEYTTQREDNLIFGSHRKDMYSSYDVMLTFLNSGGFPVNIKGARIVGDGSVAATAMLQDSGVNTQTFIRSTIQNASAGTPQQDKLSARNVKTGDQFTLTFPGVGGGITLSATASSNDPAQLYSQFIAAIAANATLLPLFGSYTISAPGVGLSDMIVYSKTNNTPFTLVAATTATGAIPNILKMTAGRRGKPDKGDWGNNLRVKVYPVGDADGSDDGYLMQIFFKGYNVQEFTSDGNDWQTLIDKVNGQGDYIMLEPENLAVNLTAIADISLTGGIYVAPAESDFRPTYDAITGEAKGAAIFDGAEVSIIVCPEVFSSDFATKMQLWCEAQGMFYGFSYPLNATEATLATFKAALKTPNQSYVAGYLNWCQIKDPDDPTGKKTLWIPGIGYVVGAAYIRKCALRNGFVWIPPGGVDTVAKGIVTFSHDKLAPTTISRYVKRYNANVIKYQDRTGWYVFSSRTYSDNGLFQSIHIRLMTNFLIKNLPLRNEKYLQEIYSPTVKKNATVDNTLYFRDIYDKGGLEKSVDFETAFSMEVTQSVADRKQVEMSMLIILPEVLEHLHIVLNRNDGILITASQA